MGWTPEQERLLWILVEQHPGERWAAAALKEIYTQSADTRGLNRLAAALVAQNQITSRRKTISLAPRFCSAPKPAALTNWPAGIRPLPEQRNHRLDLRLLIAGAGQTGRGRESLRGSESCRPGTSVHRPLLRPCPRHKFPADARKYLDLAARANCCPREKKPARGRYQKTLSG